MPGPLYRLVVKAGGVIGTAYALESAEIHIGRDAQNDIVIAEADISRRHARLTRQGSGYIIEDLGSTNGTFVNGQRLTAPYTLQPGDEVRLGPKVVLVYERVGDLDATVAVSAETLRSAPPPPPPPSPAAAAPTPPPPPAPAAAAPPPPRRPAVAPSPPPAPSAAPAKRKSWLWLFLLIAFVLFLCVVAAALWYIDANRLWCVVFPFFFPGACP